MLEYQIMDQKKLKSITDFKETWNTLLNKST